MVLTLFNPYGLSAADIRICLTAAIRRGAWKRGANRIGRYAELRELAAPPERLSSSHANTILRRSV